MAELMTMGWRTYRAAYPWGVLVMSSLPRAVLQAAFLTYLGYLAGGTAGRDFALVGACMYVMVTGTVIRGSDVVLDERPTGTMYRLRLSRQGTFRVFLSRAWVYPVEAVLSALVATVAVCALFGEPQVLLRIVAAAPLVVLTAVSAMAFALAVAVAASSWSSDVLVINVVAFALLVLTGAVAPVAALPHLLQQVASVLPMTHGIAAVRAVVDGTSWQGAAAAELAVGAGWLVVAWLAAVAEDRISRFRTSETDR